MKPFFSWVIVCTGLILCSLFFKVTSPTLITGSLLAVSLGLIVGICRKHS
jgi:hypothetical protein